MEMKFLGKGSAFYPIYGNTGAYFFKGNRLYLLDCGESMYGILQERGILDKAEQVYVLLTHLHADHVGSLGSLISYFYCVLKRPVSVIHPEITAVELLDLQGIAREGYRYDRFFPWESEDLTVEAVEVDHVKNMKCYGYILSDNDGSVYYSGDASTLPPTILTDFLTGTISRIYQDTASHDAEEPTHCYVGQLEKLIPEERRSDVYCMHLDGPYESVYKAKGFQVVQVEEGLGICR